MIFAIPGVIAALAVFLANQQGEKVITYDQQMENTVNYSDGTDLKKTPNSQKIF